MSRGPVRRSRPRRADSTTSSWARSTTESRRRQLHTRRSPINTVFPRRQSAGDAAALGGDDDRGATGARASSARSSSCRRAAASTITATSSTPAQPPEARPGEPAILYGKHADLLGQVDVALKAFYDATVELGVQNNVTTFTGIRLRPHAHVQRQGLRPRLGRAPPRHGWRGARAGRSTARSTTCRSAPAIRPTRARAG